MREKLTKRTSRLKKCMSKQVMEHRVHVIPVSDAQLHSAQAICWCFPLNTGQGNLWIHNAADCREAHERITGEKCSDGWVLIAEFRGDRQMELAR